MSQILNDEQKRAEADSDLEQQKKLEMLVQKQMTRNPQVRIFRRLSVSSIQLSIF